MARGLERTQLGVWRMESRGESTGNWSQVVKGFINHTLDRETDLDLESVWHRGFVEEGSSEWEAEEQMWERKERGDRESVRRSGGGGVGGCQAF